MSDRQEIGVAVREARIRRGLTQVELAKQLGCGRTQLTNVENGRYAPSLFTIQEVAAATRMLFTYSHERGWRIRRTAR